MSSIAIGIVLVVAAAAIIAFAVKKRRSRA